MKQGFVLGISAISGGGKTVLVKHLAERLDESVVLSFDEYDEAGHVTHPESFRRWLRDGADQNAWQAPRLAADLAQLKSGNPIASPVDRSPILPAQFVIFDAPLGRAHRSTGQHIDLMVYIDTPLDVAMARRILRDFCGDGSSLSVQQSEELRRSLEDYLEFSRAAYLMMDRHVKPSCDLVVDGLLSLDELANQLIEALKKRTELRN